MDWGILVLVLFVAACPISMMWMMRRKTADTAAGCTAAALTRARRLTPTPRNGSPSSRGHRTVEREIAELRAARPRRRDLQR